jgi:TolA-binding protein
METRQLADSTRFPLGTAASCVLLAAAAPALAQAPAPAAQPAAQAAAQAPATAAPAPAPSAPAQAVTPSDAQLRSYAKAVIDLTAIQQEMEPRIQSAAETERQALQQQAGQRMTAAVQRHDLDPNTFNLITAAAREDPELAQQLRSYVQAEAAAGR